MLSMELSLDVGFILIVSFCIVRCLLCSALVLLLFIFLTSFLSDWTSVLWLQTSPSDDMASSPVLKLLALRL